MKRVIWKAYVNFEKEEKFLNEMSANGWALTDYTFCKYVFEEAPKGEYIYRIELLEKPVNHPDSQEYIKFMEETGAEFVSSYVRWVYFRKKAADGEFNIYSDIDSRIKHYKRIRTWFWLVTALNVFAGLLNAVHGNIEHSVGFPSVNSCAALISFSVAAWALISIIMPLTKKIDFLQKEREIRE